MGQHQLSGHLLFIFDYQSESVLLKLAENTSWENIIGVEELFHVIIMSINLTIKVYLSYNAILHENRKGKFNGM